MMARDQGEPPWPLNCVHQVPSWTPTAQQPSSAHWEHWRARRPASTRGASTNLHTAALKQHNGEQASSIICFLGVTKSRSKAQVVENGMNPIVFESWGRILGFLFWLPLYHLIAADLRVCRNQSTEENTGLSFGFHQKVLSRRCTGCCYGTPA